MRGYLAVNNLDKNPRLHVLPTAYGACYAAQRRWDDDDNQWYRITQWAIPFYTMIAASTGDRMALNAWIPIDDEHTMLATMPFTMYAPVPEERRKAYDPYARIGGYLPRTSDPLTRYRPPAHRANDYMRDYVQEKSQMYSGIPRDPKTQDIAMVEGMGTIYQRNKEHLGTSDAMVIYVRRQLLKMIKAHEETGEVPVAVDNADLWAVRSASIILPEGQDWVAATDAARNAKAGAPVSYVVPR